jgi:putative peptidoglycan lipid II flippase
MDAFAIAVLVPNLLGVLISGSSASALVPALALAEKGGPQERANTFRGGVLLVAAVSLLACGFLILLSGPVIAVIASRFDALKARQAVFLLRWASPLLFFNALLSFASGELLSRRKYAVVAFAPAISTIVSLVVVLAFVRFGVAVLVHGLVAGAAVQAVLFLTPALHANPQSGWPKLRTPAVQALFRGQLPLLAASAVGVANGSIDQAVAAFLPAGNVSALNYAGTINMVVVQIVAMAASWVALPEFSRLAASGQISAFLARLRRCIAGIVMIAAPTTVLILALGQYAVQIVFQRGNFTSHSTHLVFTTWAGYTLGLIVFSAGIMLVRAINALHANRVLAVLGIIFLPLNAWLDFVFMKRWGCFGIGLSTSVVYCCTAVILYLVVGKRTGPVLDAKSWRSILGSILAALGAGAGFWLVRSQFGDGLGTAVGGTTVFFLLLLAGYSILGLVRFSTSGMTLLPRLNLYGLEN